MNKKRRLFLYMMVVCLLVSLVGLFTACTPLEFQIEKEGLHEGQTLPEVIANKDGTYTWDNGEVVLKAGTHSYSFTFVDGSGKKETHKVQLTATSHQASADKTVTVQESTCTADGIIAHVCTVCDEQYNMESVSKLDHDYTIPHNVPGTCQTKGHRTFTCERCGEERKNADGTTYIKEDANFGDHLWEIDENGEEKVYKITKQATCIENGAGFVKCSLCDAEKEVVIVDGPHSWNEVDRDLGDCVTLESYKHKCNLCGEYKKGEDGYPLVVFGEQYGDHDWEKDSKGEEIVREDKPSTCQQQGFGWVHCTKCDEGKKRVDLMIAPHNFMVGHHEPGHCHEYGYTEFECTYGCGTFKTNPDGSIYQEFDTEYGDHKFEHGACIQKYFDEDGTERICGAVDIENTSKTFEIGANPQGAGPSDIVIAILIARDPTSTGTVYYDMFIEGEGGTYQYFGQHTQLPWYAYDNRTGNDGLRYKDLIKTVSFQEGVTDLMPYMFQDCASLESVTFCESLGSNANANIPISCFEDCQKLHSVYNVPQGLTAIDYHAFRNCKALKNHNSLLTESLKTIGDRAFENNTTATVLDFRKSTKLESIGDNAFRIDSNIHPHNKKFSYVIFPATVSNMSIGGGAFLWTETNIYIEDIYDENWERKEAFSTAYTYFLGNKSSTAFDDMVTIHAPRLHTIANPNGYQITVRYRDTSNNDVTYTVTGNVIACASGFTNEANNTSQINTLQKIYDLPVGSAKFGDNLQMIGPQAFAGTGALGDVTIPASVTHICDAAFHSSTINNLTISAESQLTTICGKAFQDILTTSTGLDLYLPKTLQKVATNAFNSTNWNNIVIDMPVIPAGYGSSNTQAKSSLFNNIKSVSTITLGSNVVEIGDYAFANMNSFSAWETITIPNNVKYIGKGAFYGCALLQEIILPQDVIEIAPNAFEGTVAYTNNTTNGVTIFGNHLIKAVGKTGTYDIPDSIVTLADEAFLGCTNLTVTIPDSLEYVGERALEGVSVGDGSGEIYVGTTLLAIDSISDNTYTVKDGTTAISYGVFKNNTDLKTIIIPDSVTTIGASAFEGCTNLETITFVNNQRQVSKGNLQKIGDRAFFNCTKLANSPLSPSLTSIGEYAFYHCDAFTNVVIPDGVTAIPAYAFLSCTGLKSIDLGDGVSTIGGYAFDFCKNLEVIYFGENISSINSRAFSQKALKELHIANLAGWCSINFSLVDGFGTVNDYYTNQPAHLSSYPVKYYVNDTLLTNIDATALGIRHIGNYALSNCTSLQTLSLNMDAPNQTTIGSVAFDRCYGLKEIDIVNSNWASIQDEQTRHDTVWKGFVSFLGDGVNPSINLQMEEGEYVVTGPVSLNMFDTSLYEIEDLGSGNVGIIIKENVQVISEESFKYFDKMGIVGNVIQVTLPSSVTTIDRLAMSTKSYDKLVSIQKIIITDTDVSPSKLKTIGDRAFYGLYNLKEINIPATVTYVGYEAFFAGGLQKVYIKDMDAYANINFNALAGGGSSYDYYTSSPTANRSDVGLYLLDKQDGKYKLATEITITKGKVNKYAFFRYQHITKLTLKIGVEIVEDRAFQFTNNLTEIYVETDGKSRTIFFGNYSFDKNVAKATSLYIEGGTNLFTIAYTASNGSSNNSTLNGANKQAWIEEGGNG